MLDQIFGGEVPTAVRFVIAFGVVLALIAITFVALRKFAGRKLPLSNGGRARQPRLGVLDAFAIDSRRRLVLIRRDNVEHLIMIGGPNDVLVESEIVRNPAQAGLTPAPAAAHAAAPRAQTRPGEAVRAPIGAPPPAPMSPQHRPLPFASDAPPAAEPPAPEAAPSRSLRMPFQRERATSSGAPANQQPSSLPQAANVPLNPPNAPAPAMARTTPPRARTPEPAEPREEPAAPAPRPKADADPLYSDIEKKLGEALSRPPSAPSARPAPAAPAPAARRPESPEPAPAQPQAASKSHLDALEEEMANLLGRDRP